MTSSHTHPFVRYALSALVLASICTATVAAPLSFTARSLSLEATTVSAQTTATTGGATPSTPAAKKKVSTYDTECSINPIYFSVYGCFNVFLSWLGSWFLAFGGAILRLAGTLFDNLISHIVIGFKDSLDTLRITPAIAEAWTIFRDFSNILIIGIFTFIAVSIILGLKEFGQKKLIANVLIIAVLINFSLLFTKMIIDASNFTAFAIYKQMAAQPESFDIAQAFLTPMKITSVWDDSGEATRKVLRETGSGFQAFFFGFAGGAMLLATAGVILYGCFLIAARGVLLIVLMLTSALAFATYLLPNLASSAYGWKEWWKTLINAAVFAPLLMLLLSISLAIVSAAGSVAQTSLGSVVSNPQQQLTGDSWTTIILYIIGIGTLYMSFRLASSFAGEISHFNLAAIGPAMAFGLASRFGGVLGRQFLGRPAMNISERLQSRAANTDNAFAKRLYDFGAQRFKGVAQRDFNLARTGLGSAIAKDAKLKADTLAGASVKGFEGSQKAFMKRMSEYSTRTKPSDDQKKNAGREDARAQVTRSNADKAFMAAAVENAARSATSQQTAQEAKLEEMYTKHDQAMASLRSELTSAIEAAKSGNVGAQANVARLEKDIKTKQETHLLEIKKQSKEIEEAKQAVEKARKEVAGVDQKLDETAKQSGINKWAYQNTQERTAEAVKKSLSKYIYASGLGEASREKLAKKAGTSAKESESKHHFKEKYGDVFKEWAKESGDTHDDHKEGKSEKSSKKDDHGGDDHH